MRLWCWSTLRRNVDLRVEGLQHLARQGATLIVCRHYHHYYDGCLLLAALPRRVHILVALDWVDSRWLRLLMEAACRLARWPVVLRGERLSGARAGGRSAYRAQERVRYLRRALAQTSGLLRAGETLVIFPEAYPTIDPVYTPKSADDSYLPFRRGFIRMVDHAQRDGRTRVAIVPAGLHYERGARWRVRLRLGSPFYVDGATDSAALVRAVEDQVRALSTG
jgi:putative membrane protein